MTHLRYAGAMAMMSRRFAASLTMFADSADIRRGWSIIDELAT